MNRPCLAGATAVRNASCTLTSRSASLKLAMARRMGARFPYSIGPTVWPPAMKSGEFVYPSWIK